MEDVCQCNNQNCAGQLQSFGWGRTWSRCLGVKNTWCSISRNGQVSSATTLPTQECCDPVQETITSTITEPTIHVAMQLNAISMNNNAMLSESVINTKHLHVTLNATQPLLLHRHLLMKDGSSMEDVSKFHVQSLHA